jgi:hypothetical protein
MNDPRFAEMLKACEDNAMDKLPRKLAGLEKLRPESDEDMDLTEEELAEQGRDERFVKAFTKIGVSPMTMKHIVKATADGVTRDFDINTLKVRAQTKDKGLVWNSYVLILPWVIVAESWDAAGYKAPRWIRENAKAQLELPIRDEAGRPVLHGTDMEKFNKDNCAPNRTGMSRKPSSFKTGKMVGMMQLAKGLTPHIVGAKKNEFRTWWNIDLIGEADGLSLEQLMLDLDGEDCDDNNDLTRDVAAELVEEALEEKKILEAKWLAANTQGTEESKTLAEVEEKIRQAFDKVSNPANPRFASVWQNKRADGLPNLLQDLFTVKWSNKSPLPEVSRHIEPTETYISAEAVSQGIIYDVLSVSNPFEFGLASVAQAQQGARSLLVPGLIELPEDIEPYREMLALRISMKAELSLVVDAANKGKGFADAWETLGVAYETWTYIGLVLWGKNSPMVIQPELLAKLPRGIKSGLTSALTWEKSKDPITGVEIHIPVTDKNGFAEKTLIGHEPLDNGLWKQRRAFFDQVAAYLNNEAEMVNKEGRHHIIPMMIEDFLKIANVRKYTPEINGKKITVKDWASKVYRKFFMSPVSMNDDGSFEFVRKGKTIQQLWLARQAAFGQWLGQNNGRVDLMQKQARLTWSRQPYYWALAEMQAFVTGAEMPNDEKEMLYKEFLLAFNLVAGWSNISDRQISVDYDRKTGRFAAKGGLNLLVFMVGNDDFVGPGDALLEFLESGYSAEFAREIDAKRFERNVTVYVSIRNEARDIEEVNGAKVDNGFAYDAQDFVGRKINEILAIPGLKLAGPGGIFGGHANQERGLTFIAQRIEQLRTAEMDYLRNRIRDLKASPNEEHTDTRTLEELTADKDMLMNETQWDNFSRFGLGQQLLELIGTQVTAVEVVEIPRTADEIEKNFTPREFLKLKFGLGGDEIEVITDEDEAYSLYKAKKAGFAAELAEWESCDEDEDSSDCSDATDYSNCDEEEDEEAEVFEEDEKAKSADRFDYTDCLVDSEDEDESEEDPSEKIETQDVPEKVKEEEMKIVAPAVVKYNGKAYAFYSTSGGGLFAKLLDPQGVKYVGTPALSKLEFVKAIETKEFNGHRYFKTKAGWVASCSTGNIVSDPNILALFEEKPEPPTPPMVAPVPVVAPTVAAPWGYPAGTAATGFQMEMDIPVASSAIVLNDQQQAIFDAIVYGNDNLMVTGNAGTGKSTTIKEAIKALGRQGRWVRVCATTGIAASHIGGQTYHSSLQLFPNMKPQECAKKIQAKKPLMDFLRRHGSVVIIDEVSMMSSAEVDRMDESLRLAMSNDNAFGGLRIIFVGDFLQLEPVQKDEQMKKPFAFQAKAWAAGKVRTMKLTKVVRQSDEKFVSFLNNLRLGNVTPWMVHNLERLNKRAIPATGAVHLFTRNEDCARHNEMEMAKLPGKTYAITADDTNAKADGPKGKYLQEDWYRTEQELRLKVGAQVIHLVNDKDSGLMNGDIGTVVRFVSETKEIVVFWDRLNFEKAHMKKPDYRDSNPNSQQYRMQYPFKAAWGITIHKSQGMTLDKAVCSVGGSFAAGQVYVALSRIRTLEGLFVRSYDIDTISASAECLAFYGEKGNLRGAQAEAVDQLKLVNK